MKTDLSYLIEISNNNKEIMIEMINIFIDQVDEFIELMEKYMSNANWDALGKIAHKAKSSVSIVGMNDMAVKLKELELLAIEKKNIDKYLEYIELFKTDCKEAVEELKKYTSNL